MDLEARLLASPASPTRLVGAGAPGPIETSVWVSAPPFVVDAVTIPPGGAWIPIFDWIGRPAQILAGLGYYSCQTQACVGSKEGFYGCSQDLELGLHSSIVLVAILLIQLTASKGSDAWGFNRLWAADRWPLADPTIV